MSWQDYLQFPAMNASTLVSGRKSMKQLRYAIDNPKPETGAMLAGKVVHSLVEMDTKLDEHFAVMPDYHLWAENVTAKGEASTSKSTTFYKESVKQFHRENPLAHIVSESDLAKARGCVSAIFNDEVAKPAILECMREVSITAMIQGVECKGRLDLLALDEQKRTAIVRDIKTTTNIEKYSFFRRFNDQNMDFRLAFYRELLRADGWGVDEVELITAEQSAPFDVAVVPVPFQVLDNALDDVLRVLDQYQMSMQSGHWPGVARGRRYQLHVSEWAMREGEEEDLEFETEAGHVERS